MATATMEMEHRRAEEEDEQQQHEQPAREVGRRVSRLAVEGGADSKLGVVAARAGGKNQPLADAAAARGRALPPPHAWLAIEDGGGAARRQQQQQQRDSDDDPGDAGEQWARLLRGAGGAWGGARGPQRQRRSSFSVVRRERAAREAWLDRAWEMKRSWHERNGGAPDADTPVVVVVGKAAGSDGASPRAAGEGVHSQHHQFAAGAVGGGGVAMDVEEVRACRDLGLELPSDCTVEIQCYGLSGGSSPTHTVSSSGADSPCAVSSPGADPMDVKARLKVWAQAVALASTTHHTS